MKIREIIKRAGTLLLSVLCAFCCFLTSVTTIALAATVEATDSGSSSFRGLIRGTKSISVVEAMACFSSISSMNRYEILRQYNVDSLTSRMGVRFKHKGGELYYYFWKDDENVIHWRAVNDGNFTTWDCGCSSTSGTETDDTGEPATITGSDLKSIVADYNSRYSPMDNPEQFIWSYNSDNSVTKTKKDRSQSFYFFPQVPVYAGTSGTWGNQKWTDFYLIGFAIDDTSGVYYGKYYVHVYTKNENGSVSLITDYYSLSDGSLYQTRKGTWDIGNYPYLSMHYASGSSMFSFRGYKSASDYYGDVTPSWKTIVTSNVAMPLSASDNSGTLEFTKYVALPSFTPDTNKSDDYGFICSSKQFELFANQTGIDFQKIPDNYIITINGDTIYNYPITDPSTGNSTTINNLIINNYIIPGYPEAPDPDGPITSGVKVSGNVKVDGEINIKADPIDINVNVNSGSNGNAGNFIDPGTVDTNLDHYLEQVPELSKGFVDYLKDFLAWLPPEIYGLIILGLIVVVWCRLAGR